MLSLKPLLMRGRESPIRRPWTRRRVEPAAPSASLLELLAIRLTMALTVGFNVSMKNEHGYPFSTCWCFDLRASYQHHASIPHHALALLLLISIIPEEFLRQECVCISFRFSSFMHHHYCFSSSSFRLQRPPGVSLVQSFLIFCGSFRRWRSQYYYLPGNCSVYRKRIGMWDLSNFSFAISASVVMDKY